MPNERRKRRTRNSLIALAAMLLGSFYILVFWDSNRPLGIIEDLTEKPKQPDYFFTGITSIKYGDDGLPIHEIHARSASHVPETNDTEFIQPAMRLLNKQQPWHLEAEKALLFADGTQILLSNAVNVENEDGSASINTNAILVNAQTNTLTTNQYIEMQTATAATSAVGLEADLNLGKFTFLEQVSSRYQDQ